ncbi:hypothetical protein A3K80_07265 [Candidatus Bathyarchaeota archaeon RBG_13_38_9]|nr:MAG: hypothetical protein A3K80_07265 [Candidatus Bathyarchaeota archaeon RBG_13_38_9]
MIRQLGLMGLITILCSSQLLFIYGTVPSFPDLVWVGPLHLKAPVSIQMLTWELMSDKEVLVTITNVNSTSTQSIPYEIFSNPTNITIAMYEAPLEYHVKITAQWIDDIGHPIKIIISGGGEVYQTTIAHIRKDKISIQLFIMTIEDRSSTIDNELYSFILGLSMGASIVGIIVLIIRKRYRSKLSLTADAHTH